MKDNFLTLSCPACSANLEINPSADQLTCGFCGKVHVLKWEGNSAVLTPITSSIKQVQVGVDRTASELAIKRLSGDIEETKAKINAWNKKRSVVYSPNEPLFSYFISGLVALIGFIVLYEGGSVTFPIICFITAIGISYFSWNGYKVATQRRGKELEQVHENLAILNQSLEQKQAEFKYHEEIVTVKVNRVG